MKMDMCMCAAWVGGLPGHQQKSSYATAWNFLLQLEINWNCPKINIFFVNVQHPPNWVKSNHFWVIIVVELKILICDFEHIWALDTGFR